MTTLSWRKYQAGDIYKVECQEPDPLGGGWEETIEQSGLGLATVELNGQPVAVIGCVLCWRGVADCFAVIDRTKVKGHGKQIAAMAKARIKQCMSLYDVHRMQACADASDGTALVFLRAVGFRRESVMRCASHDKKDLILCAIVENDHG